MCFDFIESARREDSPGHDVLVREETGWRWSADDRRVFCCVTPKEDEEGEMERVMGIGGVFFKCTDKEAVANWYRDNLGIPLEEWGGAVFSWKANDERSDACTVWCPFPSDTTYFAPSTKGFMVNFRVSDLDAMLEQLRNNGCDVDEKVDESELGKFGWVLDPEGNRIELWQPPATPPTTES